MAIKCTTPCIYYHEIQNRNQKHSVKMVCDYKDGIEIKNIPTKEKEFCRNYKSFDGIKRKRPLQNDNIIIE